MAETHVPGNRTTQHNGTNHLAIKNTFFRRILTLLALKTTARLYRYDGPCIPISRHLIVKSSPFVHLTEGATLRFIAAHTSIPVPRVHCSFVYRNQAYIVMDRLHGVSLAEAYAKLSGDDRKKVFAQLRSICDELRKLPCPPGAGVQSCVGGSLRDSRIPRCKPRFGPFDTTRDFHLWLRDGLRPEEHPDRENDDDWVDIKKMVAKQDGPWPASVFTHGDLNPFNIMVDGNQVVGIVDWEFAGWYPYYWEYTAAWYGNLTRKAWQGVLTEFLDAYPDELAMEITRQKWWGE
ncbi:Protein kinase-like domain protein [Niveomyces insectorum RCEF 264]|uniref:Protein kinase-like domain protein n=1 Tax=Niveomyces insectorum RCEF 264 TaxID=1081102 RepID=A0A162I868_9HYPO|nr:Protein kinase-like domain protein [Niveomyces insectorum RCEF 264]